MSKKKIAAICAALAFIAAMVAICIAAWKPMMDFFANPETFREWVDARGFWGKAIFVGLVVLQIVIAFIPGEPLEIAAGYAFGAVEGTLLCVIGVVIGSTLIFWFVRKLGVKVVEAFFPLEKINELKFLKDSEKLNVTMFIIFFIPGTPKDILTYFAGLTNIKFGAWLFICGVGRLPSVITSTIGGDALGTQNYTFAIIVFAATALLAGVGMLIYKRIKSGGKTVG